MIRDCFDHIVMLVGQKLTKQSTNLRGTIEPELNVVVTIHIIDKGSRQEDSAAHFCLERTAVSEIILNTCQAVTEPLLLFV